MSLILEYSWWFLLLCLATGVGFALLLYYKNRNVVYNKPMRTSMAILRGLTVTLVAFLLLAPMLKFTVKQKEKPILVIAIDNSSSLKFGKDSLFYLNQFSEKIDELMHNFDKEYVVKPFLIGEKVRPLSTDLPVELNYNDKLTDLATIFDEVSHYYTNQNLGAVVLFSDGIFNAGANPYYKIESLKCPVYTVGLGNSEIEKDQMISAIHHNKQTFINNFFPVEINVMATKLVNEKSLLLVEDDLGNEVYRKEYNISGNNYFETFRFAIEAKKKGIYRYKVSISELEGEITYKNNQSSFFIEVIDAKEKIAILYHAPHPDVSALKQALELSEKYEVEVFPANNFNNKTDDYSLIILHQLPSAQNSIGTLLTDIQKKGISTLFIVGNKTNLNAFNGLNTGLIITQNKNLFNDAFPSLNNNFSLFTISDEMKQIISNFSPLQTLFGDYQVSVSANVLMYQKINNINTDYPLILFNQTAGAKIGVIAGEGIWQWKISNFLQTNNHEQFSELINKIALFLSVKADRSFFRVHAKNLYKESEDINFNAELYNESYELINEPDISMIITSENGEEYHALFSKEQNFYYLKLADLPPGTYQWHAKCELGNAKYTKSGTFVVSDVQLELQNLVADHTLLKNMAQKSKAKFYLPSTMNQLVTDIKNNENITTISTYDKIYNLLLNSWLYFVVLIFLLGSEWFLRKWGGGY